MKNENKLQLYETPELGSKYDSNLEIFKKWMPPIFIRPISARRLWTLNEPKRFDFKSPLSLFLDELLKKHNLTIREASKIAQCSPSVLHGWLHGAYPTDTVIHLKALANRYGHTLAEALTGSPDNLSDWE